MKDWALVEQYLRRISETDGITEEHLLGMREQPATESAGVTKLADESVESWRRFRKDEALTEDDKFRLEAIVLPHGLRPIFDIKNDSFATLPPPWQTLNTHVQFLESCVRGIGRVNVPGHATLEYAGTAFIVGENLALTNRHVAEQFCQTGGAIVTFTLGIAPCLDMKQEVGSSANTIARMTEPVLVLSGWDAALLRIDHMPANVTPLRLSGNPPKSLVGKVVAVVGYPALDTRGSAEEILQQIEIFRAIFGKKRMQPGRLMGFRETVSFARSVSALAHDCTTLGGNSGSAVMDVDSEAVVGLHFGGDYLVANYAVPSWELGTDQRLRDEGMLFT